MRCAEREKTRSAKKKSKQNKYLQYTAATVNDDFACITGASDLTGKKIRSAQWSDHIIEQYCKFVFQIEYTTQEPLWITIFFFPRIYVKSLVQIAFPYIEQDPRIDTSRYGCGRIMYVSFSGCSTQLGKHCEQLMANATSEYRVFFGIILFSSRYLVTWYTTIVYNRDSWNRSHILLKR